MIDKRSFGKHKDNSISLRLVLQPRLYSGVPQACSESE